MHTQRQTQTHSRAQLNSQATLQRDVELFRQGHSFIIKISPLSTHTHMLKHAHSLWIFYACGDFSLNSIHFSGIDIT